jgi:hypothetical protein
MTSRFVAAIDRAAVRARGPIDHQITEGEVVVSGGGFTFLTSDVFIIAVVKAHAKRDQREREEASEREYRSWLGTLGEQRGEREYRSWFHASG